MRFTAIQGQAVGAVASPACGIATLTDDFADGVQDRRWGRSFTDACCTQAPMALRLNCRRNGPGRDMLAV